MSSRQPYLAIRYDVMETCFQRMIMSFLFKIASFSDLKCTSFIPNNSIFVNKQQPFV